MVMERRENRSPQDEAARILVEFLEVAITSILFLKGIYPSGFYPRGLQFIGKGSKRTWENQINRNIESENFTVQFGAQLGFRSLCIFQCAFERRRYMNVVIQRARHPRLRDYIHSAVSGLLPFIQKGLVERVAVIFFSVDNIPIERFIFKLVVNQSYGSKVEEAALEFSLRSFLIKLPVSETLTKALPRDCRWEITAYFRGLPDASSSKDAEVWIPTDTKQWQKPPVISPIKSMTSEPLCLQLYLEHPSLSEPNS